MSKTYNYKRLYVWEKPVRVFHWINALSITILVATGFIIANPPAINLSREATFAFWFGIIRAIHFITAYFLIGNYLFRIYWAFVGNKFANWRNFFPYTKKGLQNIIHVLKVDIFLMRDKEHKLHNISIGHNYLAAFSYFILTLIILLQAATGLCLMSDTSSWWFPNMFAWINGLFGSNIVVRYVHHFSTWIIIAFALVHIYLVFFHDYVEARGETSAMVSGYKFVRAERVDEGEEEIIEKVTEQMWEGNKEPAKI